ncbi:hypothetical protein GPJ56_010014 [Histomonas meleagridis]|nr:hypothetical protein GPJ56_010014 [Histomonas meleagridis]
MNLDDIDSFINVYETPTPPQPSKKYEDTETQIDIPSRYTNIGIDPLPQSYNDVGVDTEIYIPPPQPQRRPLQQSQPVVNESEDIPPSQPSPPPPPPQPRQPRQPRNRYPVPNRMPPNPPIPPPRGQPPQHPTYTIRPQDFHNNFINLRHFLNNNPDNFTIFFQGWGLVSKTIIT